MIGEEEIKKKIDYYLTVIEDNKLKINDLKQQMNNVKQDIESCKIYINAFKYCLSK